MEVKHYKMLLKLYKDKVNGDLSDEEIREQKLKAKIELDNAVITGKETEGLNELINELNQL